MKDSPQPAKRRRYDADFRAETLRLAEQSRSTQAAAHALNINPRLLFIVAERGAHAGGCRPQCGTGPSHGRRAASVAGLGAAAGPEVGDLKKSHR